MVKKRKTLVEMTPSWMSDGIFTALQKLDVPWRGDGIASSLDLEYYGNVSGAKLTSPLVNRLAGNAGLTSDNLDTIANLLYATCATNWRKQYATLSQVYDPIANYSMTERMSDDTTVDEYGRTQTRTDNLSHTKTGTETSTPDLTETQTPNVTSTKSDTVYGFNSSSAKPTGGTETKATGTSTVKTAGTDATTYNTTDTDTGTVGTVDGGSDTHTRNYSLTREGNIGVTTSQQLLQSERDLWTWYYFHDVVFPDIDRVMVLKVY